MAADELPITVKTDKSGKPIAQIKTVAGPLNIGKKDEAGTHQLNICLVKPSLIENACTLDIEYIALAQPLSSETKNFLKVNGQTIVEPSIVGIAKELDVTLLNALKGTALSTKQAKEIGDYVASIGDFYNRQPKPLSSKPSPER